MFYTYCSLFETWSKDHSKSKQCNRFYYLLTCFQSTINYRYIDVINKQFSIYVGKSTVICKSQNRQKCPRKSMRRREWIFITALKVSLAVITSVSLVLFAAIKFVDRKSIIRPIFPSSVFKGVRSFCAAGGLHANKITKKLTCNIRPLFVWQLHSHSLSELNSGEITSQVRHESTLFWKKMKSLSKVVWEVL